MNIITRYIVYSIVTSMMVVMLVLLALFTFFGFLEQLQDIGQGNYDLFHALYFMMLSIPSYINQLFPMAAMIGVTVGLGMLSSNSELIAIRSAGVSLRQIVNIVLKVGALLMVLSFVTGEWVLPKTEKQAQLVKSIAMSEQLSLKGDQGLWARDGADIINVQQVLPGGKLGDIYIYTFGANQALTKMQYAKFADYREDKWRLRNLITTNFGAERVQQTFNDQSVWDTPISPDLLNVATVKPETQSTLGLYQYVEYLNRNGVASTMYEQALWSKLALPFVTGVMILLAIPFVFGPLRSVGIGHRILVGVLVGVGFHLINMLSSLLGNMYDINAAVSALLPTIVAFFVAISMLRRVY